MIPSLVVVALALEGMGGVVAFRFFPSFVFSGRTFLGAWLEHGYVFVHLLGVGLEESFFLKAHRGVLFLEDDPLLGLEERRLLKPSAMSSARK